MEKLRVGVYKFSSCDGCQLAFLNMGDTLLKVVDKVEFVHFLEMGVENDQASVDVAFVEGSISTPEDRKKIQQIRARSKYLVSIGACATSGGIQALKNIYQETDWKGSLYAEPQYISSLDRVMGVNEQVRVDHALWGCPISSSAVLALLAQIQQGVLPRPSPENVCMECKRAGHACVMVTHKRPCMGPVTRAGCCALCPGVGRDCYACYGPAEHVNDAALSTHMQALGLHARDVRHRFHFIHNHAPPFLRAGEKLQGQSDD